MSTATATSPFPTTELDDGTLILGLDRYGMRVASFDGLLYYPTDCCDATAKGGLSTVYCRCCHRDVSVRYGGTPTLADVVEPYEPDEYRPASFAR